SLVVWLQRVKAADPEAAQLLWERYFQKLVQLVRQKLPTHARRSFDEEDVALSALRCFFAAAAEGRYPQLTDRHGLWNLLVVITARKARSYLRRQNSAKRGGGAVRGESGLARPADSEGLGGIDQVLGEEPSPEFASQVADECDYLLNLLDDKTLRAIAVMK